jgi:hypothetical protein
MLTPVKNASKAFVSKMEEQREERKERIVEHIIEYPGETAYSLSKKIGIARSSMISLLNELEEELEIKFEEAVEDGRIKKKVYVRTINDFTYTYFNQESIDHPLTRKLIKNSQMNQVDITIKLVDGSEVILKPDDKLDEFIKSL